MKIKKNNIPLNFRNGNKWTFILIFFILNAFIGCKSEKGQQPKTKIETNLTASEILGNPNYQAISYGGYRKATRDIQPSISELMQDFKILAAMDIKVIRTYNTHFAQAANILKAIKTLKNEDPNFEMYVMLGAWINCKGAFTENPIHDQEEEEDNSAEIQRAVDLANQYPDIVKVIAVGNEAMVKWAASYYVEPKVILKWVQYLQNLKIQGSLSKDVWITSSDNFASWGGGDSLYHVLDLEKLIQAVDYVSLHTYPMHDTHYNPDFWGVLESEENLSEEEKIENAMRRALSYAKKQFASTKAYIEKFDKDKPVHIGETGWASVSNSFYGPEGSKATDEYKQALYYNLMREWTNKDRISCFYFEAFDEIWKDAANPQGSENHFGLFKIDGQAKFPVWNLVDQNVFKGLTRNGNEIKKTYNGQLDKLMNEVGLPKNIQEPQN